MAIHNVCERKTANPESYPPELRRMIYRQYLNTPELTLSVHQFQVAHSHYVSAILDSTEGTGFWSPFGLEDPSSKHSLYGPYFPSPYTNMHAR